jgi:hypothetical protein
VELEDAIGIGVAVVRVGLRFDVEADVAELAAVKVGDFFVALITGDLFAFDDAADLMSLLSAVAALLLTLTEAVVAVGGNTPNTRSKSESTSSGPCTVYTCAYPLSFAAGGCYE